MGQKIILCIFWVFFGTTLCVGQSREQLIIDSFIKEAEHIKSDTLKVKKLSSISFRYSTINPEKGIFYGTKALELARSIGWEPGIGIALYNRASNYMATTHFSEALRDYLLVVSVCEKHDRKYMLAGALGNIGGIYAYQKKDSNAIVYYQRALKLNRELHIGWNEAANLCNIGEVFSRRGNYQEALKFTLLGLKISIDSNYKDIQAPAYNGLAGIYLGLTDFDLTLENGLKAADLARGEDLQTFAHAMEILGNATLNAVSVKNDGLVRKYFHTDSKGAIAIAHSYLDSAVATGKELKDNLLLKEAYGDLVKLFEIQGDYEKALVNYRLYNAANDSVYNEKNTERITQLALQYEFDKKEAATRELQQKKDSRQRNIRNLISVGFGVAIVFLIVVLRQSRRISREKERSEELLLNILPAAVAKELKETGRSEPSIFENVTVLFTDFVGFTNVAERMTPYELVTELDVCFKAFDKIIASHKLEKIKTVGDAYLAVCGLPTPDKNHAKNVVAAAREIRDYMIKRRVELNGNAFQIKIGVHTGSVVAGIVGSKKFAYDIWGDTVNIAARMEQNCEPAAINISHATNVLIADQFETIYRGEIEAKNKGVLKMYYVK